MYKVFLVDDEIIVREGIRNRIPWDESPYMLSGEAPDGELALSLIHDLKPDILITDIRMPFIDGLELSRMVKTTFPWIKIIILSGHDEFEYAKQAISIGVEEYLLKPVSTEELITSLGKVAQQIEDSRRMMKNLTTLEEQVHSSHQVLREKVLCDIVTGVISPNQIIYEANKYAIDLIAHAYNVLVIDFPDNGTDTSSSSVVRSIMEMLFGERTDVLFFVCSNEMFVVLIKGNSSSLEDLTYSIASGVRHQLKTLCENSPSIGIGSIVDRMGDIKNSYHDAARALQFSRYSGDGIIVGFEDLHQIQPSESRFSDLKSIGENIKFLSFGDIDAFVEDCRKKACASPLESPLVSSFILMDTLNKANHMIEELGGDPKKIFPPHITHDSLEHATLKADVLCHYLVVILQSAILFRDSLQESRYGEMLLKAKRFIQEKYNDPDISLKLVADEVNLSPNHFSTVFSQETGNSFIEYLTTVRIQHAKELLTKTVKRSSEIAYEVGFNDHHYFSYIFKKYTGVTVREFRSVLMNHRAD